MSLFTQKYSSCRAYVFLILTLSMAIFSCKTNKIESTSLSKTTLVSCLDSLSASHAIVDDDIDGFFDKISIIDMAIQMKVSRNVTDRTQMLENYKSYLRTSVSNWKIEEKVEIEKIFVKAKAICDNVGPAVWPNDIRIIKIKTNHYGSDVYYTRGKNILIPENVFEEKEYDKQLPIMLHEIFHLISRHNPKVRDELYALIGFVKSEKPIVVDPKLANIALTNPDGVSTNYYLSLKNNDKETKIIPMITSKNRSFKVGTPAFFDYLSFDLYPIKLNGDHYITMSDEKGKTTLDVAETPSFFQQIKDNTQYIIHPDEIIADNFMLALQAFKTKEYKNFSPEGKKLIDDVIAVLQKMK